MSLMLRGLLGGLLQVALFAVLLFVPAGTWCWPRAIEFLASYALLSCVVIIVLARIAPASLEARLQPPFAKSQPLADRIVSAFLFFALFAWFALIPVDVFHLRFLPPPSPMVSLLGAVVFFIGYGIDTVSLYQNEFAAPIVKDQSERGHVLIDTGLYAYVRHPFYLGSLLFLIGIALWLGSYASVLGLALVLAPLVARILVEEQTLRETLPGYVEYMARVRYRLIPFVW